MNPAGFSKSRLWHVLTISKANNCGCFYLACTVTTQFISPSLALSSPALFSFFFRGDLERERDRRDFRLSFSDSLVCDRVLFGDLSSFVESSSSSGSICSFSGFSSFGFFSSFLPSLSSIGSNDRGMCAR